MPAQQTAIPEPAVPLKRPTRPVHGLLYIINGIPTSHAKRFAVNFITGDDVALHIDHRFNEHAVVRNTRLKGAWGDEERSGGRLPLSTGHHFELMLLAEESGFSIAYNGTHYAQFQHRMALDKINAIHIDGDVQLLFYRETQPPSDLLSAIADPLAVDHVPLKVDADSGEAELPGGIRADRVLHICGIPGQKAYNMDFFRKGRCEEVGLHISFRAKEGGMVLNSRQASKWQHEVRPKNIAVREGEHFDVEIAAVKDKIHILMNGAQLAVFTKRDIPPAEMTNLRIYGDGSLVNASIEVNQFVKQ